MRAGIIAAGLGERLKSTGLPKPLTPVAGRPLIHWTVEALVAAGADRVTILLNTRGGEVRRSLEAAFPAVAWRFLVWDSPSSWQSFRRVCLDVAAEEERFVVSTADALARTEDVARFAREALSSPADAVLALTPFVDDEKPLWADVEGAAVTRVGDDATAKRWATCGLYGMSRAEARGLEARSHERLRDYWMDAARRGRRIGAVVLEKTIDVDRPEDVTSAERFLAGRSPAVPRVDGVIGKRGLAGRSPAAPGPEGPGESFKTPAVVGTTGRPA